MQPEEPIQTVESELRKFLEKFKGDPKSIDRVISITNVFATLDEQTKKYFLGEFISPFTNHILNSR
jgi:hypothetical protein